MNSTDQQGISVNVDNNPYLAEGFGTVDAIITIAVSSRAVEPEDPPQRVEAIVIDCSSSMLAPEEKFRAAKNATIAALDELQDGTYFTIVAGNDRCRPVYPAEGPPTPATASTRATAASMVAALQAQGGTAMGSWLAHIRSVADRFPSAITHAILLTDGRDEHEKPDDLQREIALSEGKFSCDCRGIGTDWRVDELRAISSALLGNVDIVADPADLAEDFAAMVRTSMAKSIPKLTLRLWTPTGATVVFVKQVAPTVEDLTDRRADAGSQCADYPLGAWGAEERDYHLQVEIEPAAVGREKLAARVTVIADAEVLGEEKVRAIWTDDTTLSAQVSRGVAHYTDQAELAQAIRDGLTARENGELGVATAKLKRALTLAVESGHQDTAKLLRQVVEVDQHTGTARLRPAISAADEMALGARSTRTVRVRREK